MDDIRTSLTKSTLRKVLKRLHYPWFRRINDYYQERVSLFSFRKVVM